jgi:hypothetical protein
VGKLQLIKEFALSVDSYIQKIIGIVKADKMMEVKSKTLGELPMPLLDRHETEEREQLIKVTSWIRFIFTANEIDLVDF